MTKTRSPDLEDAVEAMRQQQFEEAVTILERLAETRGNDPEVLVYLGVAYVQAERPRKAIDVLRRAEEIVEDHPVIAQFLGRSYKAIKEYALAERYLEMAVSLDPEAYDSWLDLGEVLYLSQQYGRAADVLSTACERFPGDAALHSILAMAFYRLGDYTQAADEWSVVYRQRPDSIVALANYAYTLLYLGRIEDTLPLMERAKEIAPTHYRTLMICGEVEFQRGNLDVAQEYFERALDKCSVSAEALGRLALIEEFRGNIKRAEFYLTLVRELMERDPSAWQRTCDIHVRRGDYDGHLQCLHGAVERDPNSPAAWVGLASELQRRGLREEASEAWMKAIELRGYVKVYCPRCHIYQRYDISDTTEKVLSVAVTCPGCSEELPLPESLAVV